MEYSTNELRPFIFGLPWFGVEDLSFYRFPQGKLPQLPEAVRHLATHPSGGVIRFRARTKVIAFEFFRPLEPIMNAFSQVGQYALDFYQDGRWLTVLVPREGTSHMWVPADETMEHEYAIYLSTYAPVEVRTLALEGDYPGVPSDGPTCLPPTPYAVPGRIVVYGSSITQGAFASRPGLAYPARLGRLLNAEVVNLGFAGAGKGEHEVADLLASVPAVSLYIMDWGANICDPKEVELIRERYPYMMAKIRERHPAVPVIFVVTQSFRMEYVDPVMARSFQVIREAIRKAYAVEQAAGRPCAIVEGEKIIGPGDWDYTVDGAHATDEGFGRYVQAIAPVAQKLLQLTAGNPK